MHPPAPQPAAPAEATPDVDARMAAVLEALARARSVADLERLRRSTDAAGIAAYHWTISSDALDWSGAAEAVLGISGARAPVSGKAYAALLDPAAEAGRFDAVMRPAVDPGPGVAYSVTYPLRRGPDDAERILIEDTGRWFAGPDGRPAEAYGVVRRVKRGGGPRLSTVAPDTDALTGALARAPLLDALAHAVSEAARTGHPCAFVAVSITNLRLLNDAYGIAVGDAAVAVTGRRLRQVARTSDTVGRLTGSTFGVVLRHCTQDQLRVVAERFLAASRDGVETGLGLVWPHTVIGSAVSPDHAGTATDLLAAAEAALAAAQQSENPVAIFAPPAVVPSLRSLTAQSATEISGALNGNRFRLAYRPVVSAQDGQIVLYDTSLDILDASGERLPAHHMMPLAEQLGVVRLIDRQMLTLALDALDERPDLGLLTTISPVSAADPRWLTRALGMIAERENAASRLTIAVPGASLPVGCAGELAEGLRNAGSRLALGAEGVAASAADIVIADIAALARDIGADSAAGQPVAMLAASAHAAGRLIMAGPVETADQAETLRALGVDCLWGPLFGGAAMEPSPAPAYRLTPRSGPPSSLPPAPAAVSPLARARAALDQGREEILSPRS